MKRGDKLKKHISDRFVLTADEADYIAQTVLRNEKIIKTVIYNVLKPNYISLVEDCISETALLCCRKIKELKKTDNPDRWIIAASKNIALNMLHKQQNYIEYHELTDTEIDVASDDLFEEVHYNILLKEFNSGKFFEILTPREKELYDLLFVENMKPKIISERLNISVNTVWCIKKSIVDKIKKAIYEKNF